MVLEVPETPAFEVGVTVWDYSQVYNLSVDIPSFQFQIMYLSHSGQ